MHRRQVVVNRPRGDAHLTFHPSFWPQTNHRAPIACLYLERPGGRVHVVTQQLHREAHLDAIPGPIWITMHRMSFLDATQVSKCS